MGRPKRISFPGATYHICVQGNNRQIIFLDDYDCHKFIELLRANKAKYGFYVLAYVLLPDHFHLAVQVTDKTNISKIMQVLNTAYSRYFNQRHSHSGHLLENRFLSNLVSPDKHLLEITCYIHLNPIRMGVAEDPQDYKWSSYSVYINKQEDKLVDKDKALELLSPDKNEQARLYGEFVMAKIPDGAGELREKIAKERVIGNEEFIRQMREQFKIGGRGVRGRPKKLIVEK